MSAYYQVNIITNFGHLKK